MKTVEEIKEKIAEQIDIVSSGCDDCPIINCKVLPCHAIDTVLNSILAWIESEEES